MIKSSSEFKPYNIGRFHYVLIGQILLLLVKGSWKVSIYMKCK